MSADVTRYPLAWPRGWPRTSGAQRRRARFKTSRRRVDGGASWVTHAELTIAQALGRLDLELDRLNARHPIVSTNVEVRLDGSPRSDRRNPDDPGIAVYFQLDGKPRVLACDRWDRVADNLAAVAAHIEAIRAVERYGVGALAQVFAGYAALPPVASVDWWVVLGVPPTADAVTIDAAFRRLARIYHPDTGGSTANHDTMAKLTEARAAALAARS
jgi:DnaJ-domain-containing protein 1